MYKFPRAEHTIPMMKTILKNFLKCGTLGWCLEILFTALHSLRRRDLTLMGHTSIWMFPIYGSGCLLTPLFQVLKKLPVFLRGCIYASLIFLVEYFSGSLLSKKKLCPWNYGKSRWHIHEVIRLDYLPCWFLVGLLYEKLLKKAA